MQSLIDNPSRLYESLLQCSEKNVRSSVADIVSHCLDLVSQHETEILDLEAQVFPLITTKKSLLIS